MGHLIMGEHGCAAASLWLGHVPSIGLPIGSRQVQTTVTAASSQNFITSSDLV